MEEFNDSHGELNDSDQLYIDLDSSRVEVVIIEETVSRIGSAAGRVPQDWKRQLGTRRKNHFSKDSNVISIKLSIIK